MLSSEITEAKIAKARTLSSLEDHPGWKIVREKLEAQLLTESEALTSIGMSHDETQRRRYRIEVMRWVLKSTTLDNPDQLSKWEADLAFQRKAEQNRKDLGLPQSVKELMRPQA